MAASNYKRGIQFSLFTPSVFKEETCYLKVIDMQKGERFLNIYGYVFLAIFVGCLYTLYALSKLENVASFSYVFDISFTLWYLITGYGILKRKRWALYFFKFFLYIFFLGFPIGTIISFMSLKYIKNNNISALFNGYSST